MTYLDQEPVVKNRNGRDKLTSPEDELIMDAASRRANTIAKLMTKLEQYSAELDEILESEKPDMERARRISAIIQNLTKTQQREEARVAALSLRNIKQH